jgi:DNA-binding MarR family transcriptional regulator
MAEQTDPPKPDQVGPLSEELTALFYRVVRLISVASESSLLQDLPVLQTRLLRLIDEEPGKNVADLTKSMRHTVSGVSRMLTNLEKKGLIERVADQHDKRVVRIFVTAVARNALSQRNEQRVDRMRQCLQHMSNDAALRVVESLHLLARAAEQTNNEAKPR